MSARDAVCTTHPHLPYLDRETRPVDYRVGPLLGSRYAVRLHCGRSADIGRRDECGQPYTS